MNAKKMKSTVVALSIILVICLTIAGTITYLQDSTDPVVNTFTTSDIDITLAETPTEGGSTTANTYKMVPGATITKDPKVTVLANSEACYLFVKIEKDNGFDTYMEYGMAAGWNELSGVDGVYYRQVATSTEAQPFDILLNNQVTVKTSVTKEQMEALKESGNLPKLTFTAYAIQSENLADKNGDGRVDAADAWALIGG